LKRFFKWCVTPSASWRGASLTSAANSGPQGLSQPGADCAEALQRQRDAVACQALAVLDARETLFLGGGDELAVAH
jgi:LmbE family N-acetylglucosaminyl deacetylase